MKKAFTLIELMVVVAIIAVLTTIALAQFSTTKAKSRDAKRISDLAQIQLAIQLYFDRCGQYPNSTVSGSNTTGPTLKPDVLSSCGTVTLGSFIRAIPNGPSYPSATDPYYKYRYIVHKSPTTGLNDDYYLGAKLELPSSALDDDIDDVVGGAISAGWSGWSASTGGTPSFNASDDALIYAIGSK